MRSYGSKLLVGGVFASVVVLAAAAPALANPFGVGIPAEPVVGGPFDQLIAWTAGAQAQFYQGLTGSLRSVESSTAALWSLLGLSFLYGVVHAAGPGHGKIVIGSYMLASGETARKGAMLALAAAMLQSTIAVACVGLLAGVFGLSQAVLVSATLNLERFAYALIIALGLYILLKALRSLVPSRPLPMVVAAGHHGETVHHHAHTEHAHGPDCGCGHAHMPDAKSVEGSRSAGQTLALVASAGLRPCTGALLVLVLALSQGLFWQGAAASYLMGLGTALTLALMAAFASGLSRFIAPNGAGATGWARAASRALQVVGAALIIGFGALLLAASLGR
ncbi:MAG: hypothetical protein AAF739_05730 [Pseudomonadota bacterium]